MTKARTLADGAWNARYVDNGDTPVTAADWDKIYVDTSAGVVEIDLPAAGRVWIIDQTGDAQTYNITVDPAGVSTTTIDTIDLAYFSAVFEFDGTSNWGIS